MSFHLYIIYKRKPTQSAIVGMLPKFEANRLPDKGGRVDEMITEGPVLKMAIRTWKTQRDDVRGNVLRQ